MTPRPLASLRPVPARVAKQVKVRKQAAQQNMRAPAIAADLRNVARLTPQNVKRGHEDGTVRMGQ